MIVAVVTWHVARDIAAVVEDGDFHVGLAAGIAAHDERTAVAVVESLASLAVLDGDLGIVMRRKDEIHLFAIGLSLPGVHILELGIFLEKRIACHGREGCRTFRTARY